MRAARVMRGSLVGAVQGNVPQQGADWAEQARDVTANHAEGTERLAATAGRRKLDLVVWPESAADIDPRTELVDCVDTISDKARAVGGGVLDAVLQGLVAEASTRP